MRKLALGILPCLLLLYPGCSAAAPSESVFLGPRASYAERIAPEQESDYLRRIVARDPLESGRDEVILRIPLFFHRGEVREADALHLRYADDPARRIVTQADSVRLAEDGGVARCELYALVDLRGRDEVELLLHADGPSKVTWDDSIGVALHGDQIAFEGEGLVAVFNAKGDFRGRIRSMEAGGVSLDFGPSGGGPSGVFQFQDLNCQVLRKESLDSGDAAGSIFEWGVGPLFAKVVVTYELDQLGGGVRYTYRVPKYGIGLEQSYFTFVRDAEEAGAITIAEHRALEGQSAGMEWRSERVPVGLRSDVPFPHGHAGKALVEQGQGMAALYPVPYVHDLIREAKSDGENLVVVARDQVRLPNGGSEAIRRVWGSVTYLLTAAEKGSDLWEPGLFVSNPPVAIVDEPGLGKEALLAMVKRLLEEQKPVGFGPKLAERVLESRNVQGIGRQLGRRAGESVDAEVSRRVREARVSYEEKVASLGRPLREHEKGKAYGGLDPYHITFQDTVVGALAYLNDPRFSPEARDYAYVLGRATMEALGKEAPGGNVYLDTFHTALNMQTGPLMLGLIGGKAREDREVVDFYRRLALGDGVRGLYGKGQRSYRSIEDGPSQSDLLYQDLSDFFLRATEIMAGEDLQTHPAAFARYLHCLSVDADLVQREWSEGGRRAAANRRAHMYRAQAHDHRWESWNASPLMSLFWPGKENEAGHTETLYALDRLRGKWVNWPDYSYYFIAYALLGEE